MEATRTLVKSPPELWAELSDVAALTRHLGEFGEIRITRTEPESVVEWEGDRASGSVRLEPSGWGTRVTLTVDPVAAKEKAAPDTRAVVEPADGPRGDDAAQADPTAAAVDPRAAGTEDEIAHEAEADDSVERGEPTAAVEPEPEPAAMPRRGFFARLFRWRSRRTAAKARAAEEAEDAVRATVDAPEPTLTQSAGDSGERPQPDDAAAVEPAADPETPAPELVAEEGGAPDTADGAPAPPPPSEADPAAVLTQTLDALGAAHHRPFSR